MTDLNSDIDFFDELPELRPEFIEKVSRERAKSQKTYKMFPQTKI